MSLRRPGWRYGRRFVGTWDPSHPSLLSSHSVSDLVPPRLPPLLALQGCLRPATTTRPKRTATVAEPRLERRPTCTGARKTPVSAASSDSKPVPPTTRTPEPPSSPRPRGIPPEVGSGNRGGPTSIRRNPRARGRPPLVSTSGNPSAPPPSHRVLSTAPTPTAGPTTTRRRHPRAGGVVVPSVTFSHTRVGSSGVVGVGGEGRRPEPKGCVPRHPRPRVSRRPAGPPPVPVRSGRGDPSQRSVGERCRGATARAST